MNKQPSKDFDRLDRNYQEIQKQGQTLIKGACAHQILSFQTVQNERERIKKRQASGSSAVKEKDFIWQADGSSR